MASASPPIILEGLISIEAALLSDSRPVNTLIVRENHRDYEVTKLIKTAEARGVPLYRVPEDEIDALAHGNTHGGVLAFVGERRFVTLDALVKNTERPFVVMLDGVEDPFNFGQSIRAFYAAGAHGLVVRPRNWIGGAAAIVARASAGASEWMPTALAETLEQAADFFRMRGMRVAVADQRRAKPIYDVDLNMPVFVVIGGEKRGITRSFADSADVRVHIPYARDYDQALGTTAASAVLAFEIARQRRK